MAVEWKISLNTPNNFVNWPFLSTSFYKCENAIPEQEGGNGPVLTAKSLAYTGFNVQIPP